MCEESRYLEEDILYDIESKIRKKMNVEETEVKNKRIKLQIKVND